MTMGKTYLSFLGTSNYVPCSYHFGGAHVDDIRFVQEATVQIFVGNWSEQDRICIFTTEEAYKKNWLDGGHVDDAGRSLTGLGNRLAALKLPCLIRRIPIPEGKSEAEIWQIFQIVFDQLTNQDQVVFDITHAFRSIPMLAMVVLPYARVMKDISVLGIYYGAFEVLGHPNHVKTLPMEQRSVPIFDLTPFSALLDWSLAVDRFLGAGDARPACQLTQDHVLPILRETRGNDQVAKLIKNVAHQLQKFSEAIATCRGPLLSDIVKNLCQNIAQCRKETGLAPLNPLLDKVQERLAAFDGDAIHDGLRAARWCLDHNLIQQGFTILQEFLVSYCVQQVGGDPLERHYRDIVTQAVNIHINKRPPEQWKSPASTHSDITRDLLSTFASQADLPKLLDALSECRNDLNHAAFRKSYRSAQDFRNKLQEFLEKSEELVFAGKPCSM